MGGKPNRGTPADRRLSANRSRKTVRKATPTKARATTTKATKRTR